jgi:hypothetical protein
MTSSVFFPPQKQEMDKEGREKEKERGRRGKEAVVRLSLPRLKLRYLIAVAASTFDTDSYPFSDGRGENSCGPR